MNDDLLYNLDLSSTIFNEETFNKLCESLKDNSKITDINFSGCEFPSIGSSDKLIDMLDHNLTILNINMKNTINMSEEDKIKIKDKLSGIINIKKY